jgi:hypothetical protein
MNISKNIFFIIGFQRCGSTLLRSILNQNSEIFVTPNSILASIVYQIYDIKNTDVYTELNDFKPFKRILNKVFDLYYQDKTQKYILDQGPWGTPGNFEVLQQINFNNKLKFICLIRPLNEMLASWCRINKPINVEEYIDGLIDKRAVIGKTMWSIDNLKNNNQEILFINYDNFCKQPEQIINKIYKFLNIRSFKHSFKNLKQPTTSNEILKFGNQLIIRQEVKKIKRDYDSFCPSKFLVKHKNLSNKINNLIHESI